MYGYYIIPFNKEDKNDIYLLKTLEVAVAKATRLSNELGLFATRVNKVGNHMETSVNALNEEGLEARIPLTKKGKPKTYGYPDLKVMDKNGRRTCLQYKTFSIKRLGSNQRTFYFSPSDIFKITSDAWRRHLLISFEIIEAQRNNKNCYVPINWRVYALDKLKVNVKHEFNASNRTLYLNDSLLAKEDT